MRRLLAIIYQPLGLKILFVLYAAALIFLVFFAPIRYMFYNRLPPVYFIPFHTIIGGLHKTPGEHFWPYYTWYFNNVAGNIILFMPMGFLLKALNTTKSIVQIVMMGALVSISIELLQFTFRVGVCDIDDVLLNTLGTFCGVLLLKSVESELER